jgi:DNA polymerase III sliding clamp (beta) subunit (PCNA family)
VTIRLDRKAFLDVINRVALLTSDTVRLIVMDFAGGTGTISTGAGASAAVLGEASETLDVEQSGADVRIGLNHEYVRQFLSVCDTEKVEIRLKDSTTQALFQPAGQAAGYQYVVMPMRLG